MGILDTRVRREGHPADCDMVNVGTETGPYWVYLWQAEKLGAVDRLPNGEYVERPPRAPVIREDH